MACWRSACLPLMVACLWIAALASEPTCTDSGVNCVFPFRYQGRHFNSCIGGSLGAWCGIKADVVENKKNVDYSYCRKCPKSECTEEGFKCIWPYIDENGLNHTSCITEEGWFNSYMWCPIVENFKGGRGNGKCADSCPADGPVLFSSVWPYDISPTVPATTISPSPTSMATDGQSTKENVAPVKFVQNSTTTRSQTNAERFETSHSLETSSVGRTEIDGYSSTAIAVGTTELGTPTFTQIQYISGAEQSTLEAANASSSLPTVQPKNIAPQATMLTISTTHTGSDAKTTTASSTAPPIDHSLLWIVVGMLSGVLLLIGFVACCCCKSRCSGYEKNNESPRKEADVETAVPLMQKTVTVAAMVQYDTTEAKPREEGSGSGTSTPDSGVDEITQAV